MPSPPPHFARPLDRSVVAADRRHSDAPTTFKDTDARLHARTLRCSAQGARRPYVPRPACSRIRRKPLSFPGGMLFGYNTCLDVFFSSMSECLLFDSDDSSCVVVTITCLLVASVLFRHQIVLNFMRSGVRYWPQVNRRRTKPPTTTPRGRVTTQSFFFTVCTIVHKNCCSQLVAGSR